MLNQNHQKIEKLRIGTRASPLALIQSRLIRNALISQFTALEDKIEIVPIKASGDHNLLKDNDEPLMFKGGKGLFTKELEEALLANHIDIAVHSMKDVPTWMPQGLILAGVIEREDARDVFISPHVKEITELKKGAVIGTSSLRRQAQILNLRPDLIIVPLRGNVDTRLKKIASGLADATFLAAAGLKRLSLFDENMSLIDPSVMLPSPGQGAVGMQIRERNDPVAQMLEAITCQKTYPEVKAERAMLQVLDGSCQTPIGGYAMTIDGQLFLRGLVAHPDGKGIWHAQANGAITSAIDLGKAVGRDLRTQVPAGILPD